MLTTPLPQVPVRSATELTRRWAQLLDPPVFAARSLWLARLDTEGLMLPVIVPVDDLPPTPDPATVRGLLQLHEVITERDGVADGHLALALCRPGGVLVTADDDDWAETLRETFDDRIDGTWSLHLAADGRVVPLVAAPPSAWR